MQYNPKLDRTVSGSVDLIQMKKPTWISDYEEVSWDLRSPITTGKYVAELEGIQFHFLLCDRFSESDRVIVSLTGGVYGSNREGGPRFSRWTYTEYTDASMVCIDDPMIFQHGLRYGWFGGGTEERPMWVSTGDLICSIIKASGIKAPKVTFLSSSSGGTASILVSSIIGQRCTVVAINPQIYLPASVNYKKAVEKGLNGILVKNPDFVSDIVREHQENDYLIMINVASRVDYERHYLHLADAISISPRFGITVSGNVMSWLYYAPSSDPHSAVDWITLYPVIEFLVASISGKMKVPDNMLDAFNRMVSEHHEASKRLLMERVDKEANIVKKAVVYANSGDFDILDKIISTIESEDLKKYKICNLISKYPNRGFHCACVLMHGGFISSDVSMASLIIPVVCGRIVEKNNEAWKAVRKLIESPNTKKSVLEVLADWMRNPAVVDNFFVSNALVDILWKLNTPESLSEMTKVAENSASKGNARAIARMSKMYYYGRGYEKNLDLAEELAVKALDQGVPWASGILKRIRGRGEKTDPDST